MRNASRDEAQAGINIARRNTNNFRYADDTTVPFSSVAQLCPTLCDLMDCSMPGFPVYYPLLELAQTHVHLVSHAIQPSGLEY